MENNSENGLLIIKAYHIFRLFQDRIPLNRKNFSVCSLNGGEVLYLREKKFLLKGLFSEIACFWLRAVELTKNSGNSLYSMMC